jgi:hypothetical protein
MKPIITGKPNQILSRSGTKSAARKITPKLIKNSAKPRQLTGPQIMRVPFQCNRKRGNQMPSVAYTPQIIVRMGEIIFIL